MPTACPPTWGQRGNGERLFHGEAWQGVMARVGQATSRVLVWFCVVKHESIGRFQHDMAAVQVFDNFLCVLLRRSCLDRDRRIARAGHPG